MHAKTVSKSGENLQPPALNRIYILFVVRRCHFILWLGHKIFTKVENHGCN